MEFSRRRGLRGRGVSNVRKFEVWGIELGPAKQKTTRHANVQGSVTAMSATAVSPRPQTPRPQIPGRVRSELRL